MCTTKKKCGCGHGIIVFINACVLASAFICLSFCFMVAATGILYDFEGDENIVFVYKNLINVCNDKLRQRTLIMIGFCGALRTSEKCGILKRRKTQ